VTEITYKGGKCGRELVPYSPTEKWTGRLDQARILTFKVVTAVGTKSTSPSAVGRYVNWGQYYLIKPALRDVPVLVGRDESGGSERKREVTFSIKKFLCP